MRILLLEGNPAAGSRTRHHLAGAGHDVMGTRSSMDALHLLRHRSWDLLVIDCATIEVEGLGPMCAPRGNDAAVSVLLLNRLRSEADEGLEASESLPPGFDKETLINRIESMELKPYRTPAEAVLHLGDVQINLLTRHVTRSGRVIQLAPREFRLLECLVRSADTALDRDTLRKRVWDYHFDPRTNVVESHISRLRAKLDRPFAVKLIQTVRGIGYCIHVPP